jgi:hypothetical protein
MATWSNGCACKVESFALAKLASEAYACADFENKFPPSSIQETHFQLRLESTFITQHSNTF